MTVRRETTKRYTRMFQTIWMICFPLYVFDIALKSKLSNYVNPKYNWLVLGGCMALFVLGIVILVLKRWKGEPGGHDHSGGAFGLVFWTAIIYLPLVLGLVVGTGALSTRGARQSGMEVGITPTAASRAGEEAAGGETAGWNFEDWFYAVAGDPEPENYEGEKANIEGAVMSVPEVPDDCFILNRYLILCCAADAVPVGFPVRVKEGLRIPPDDTWVRVSGTMTADEIGGRRMVVLEADTVEEVEAPDDPYIY
ncbi:MAG: TIGR03943 family protein [Actinobacteria bacterium]|nr:TIGR03943 family protein [Actinomycetota bacterium]MCG2818637.1 TIGR03943 family protein [Actinomycetes bacterium]MBU4218174.1 TIGR03943 family protein [Actinomycetota bacterium]MBU4358599.1 TIGR03943 family protein [Actinomycetota bacterium]MBU4392086.1 TIGR03943 family protein [Actinomycetota bacterium]